MAVYVVEKMIGDLMVLDVRGQITLGDETSALREKTKSLVDAGHTKIIVDLAEVNYIDSAGLATLVSLYTSARRQGGDVKLLRLTNRVRGLLQITRLSTVFEIYDDLEAAKKSFANSSKTE
jgi:anti-sigma B factor antagonist